MAQAASAQGSRTWVCAPRASVFALGSDLLLFCERSQQLSLLSPDAAEAWRLLSGGAAFDTMRDAVSAQHGFPTQQCAERLTDVIDAWVRLGFVVPAWVVAARSGAPENSRICRVGPVEAELRAFRGAPCPELVARPPDPTEPPAERISIEVVGAPEEGVDYVFLDGEPLGTVPSETTVPKIKALLTEALCRAVRDGFLAHGALLSRGGVPVFLHGAPGDGKTTLALAMAGRGFAFAGDDIVHIRGDGVSEGVPFAAAAKSGAWALLDAFLPDLNALPIYRREDGQITRYVLPSERDRSGPRPIRLFLELARRPGACAAFEPVQPLHALTLMIGSGYAERRSMSAQTLVGLASALGRARCGRLVYDDLGEAVALVKRLADELDGRDAV